MRKLSKLVPALLGIALVASGCSAVDKGPGRTGGKPQGSGGLSGVVLVGDSIAAGEALPLTQALAASDVLFTSFAADGGGNVVGPFSDEGWKTLPKRISDAHPSLLIYQVTTYDWGNPPTQKAAYRKLVTTVEQAGAKLVFVSMPPIRPDDFYRPHMADLQRASGVAREVAEGSAGRATFLDAGEVWGSGYQQVRNGTADRSKDGVHTCPQGAARFTAWLLKKLTKVFAGFQPASAASWANTGWADDKRFRGC
jgi:hypothetical protein